MKQVVIYGGAFNPPTKAHQEIARAGIEHAEAIDGSFWLVLSGDRRDKEIGIDREKRILFGEALLSSVQAECETVVTTFELDQETSQTEDTVRYLEETYPDTQFTWIFGSDSIQTMPEWSGGSRLLKNLQMLVVQRARYEVELLPNMTALDVDTIEVSSTLVRESLQSKRPVSHLVPPEVLAVM